MPRTISSRIVGQILNGKLGVWDDRAGPEVHSCGLWAFGRHFLKAGSLSSHQTQNTV